MLIQFRPIVAPQVLSNAALVSVPPPQPVNEGSRVGCVGESSRFLLQQSLSHPTETLSQFTTIDFLCRALSPQADRVSSAIDERSNATDPSLVRIASELRFNVATRRDTARISQTAMAMWPLALIGLSARCSPWSEAFRISGKLFNRIYARILLRAFIALKDRRPGTRVASMWTRTLPGVEAIMLVLSLGSEKIC